MKKIKNYINGKLVEPINKKFIDNLNPSTGKKYSLIPDSQKEDVLLAVNSAKKAFCSWKKKTKKEENICLELSKHFKEEGLFFVGIDVINGMLSEINVTSPTGLREIETLSNKKKN